MRERSKWERETVSNTPDRGFSSSTAPSWGSSNARQGGTYLVATLMVAWAGLRSTPPQTEPRKGAWFWQDGGGRDNDDKDVEYSVVNRCEDCKRGVPAVLVFGPLGRAPKEVRWPNWVQNVLVSPLMSHRERCLPLYRRHEVCAYFVCFLLPTSDDVHYSSFDRKPAAAVEDHGYVVKDERPSDIGLASGLSRGRARTSLCLDFSANLRAGSERPVHCHSTISPLYCSVLAVFDIARLFAQTFRAQPELARRNIL